MSPLELISAHTVQLVCCVLSDKACKNADAFHELDSNETFSDTVANLVLRLLLHLLCFDSVAKLSSFKSQL